MLDAQTQLAATQRDLYKARYDVILATVKLRQASGTLRLDLGNLNKLFVCPSQLSATGAAHKDERRQNLRLSYSLTGVFQSCLINA